MTVKSSSGFVQVGASSTAANNLTIDTSANNGTAKIYMGNAGSQVTNIATVASNGVLQFGVRPAIIGTQSMIILHGGGALGSTNTQIRRYSTTDVNQGTDITYADSATLGASFTINTAGVYSMVQEEIANAASVLFAILVNATSQPASVGVTMPAAAHTTGNNAAGVVSWCGYLNAGDVVRPSLNGAGGTSQTTNAAFSISRIA